MSDDITSLPFVQDRKKSKKNNRPRDFWVMPQTDDYHAQCVIGRAYAQEAIDYMLRSDWPFIIGWAAADMIRRGEADGFVVGFFKEISVQLMRGRG